MPNFLIAKNKIEETKVNGINKKSHKEIILFKNLFIYV